MISTITAALLFACAFAAEEPQLWAVLVAGSNYYYNYRHQADVCHAYQILSKHGIPDERIIVMMYDDIANAEENPTPGIIVNHINGSDVYKGVSKDYIGDSVTPANFIKVLKGEKPEGGSGKTLNAGPNDHVFVNFVDHGAPGLLAFPGDAPVFTLKELKETLEAMREKKKYGKLVWYVEACESGSMFEKWLPKNISVFATTAANGEESSYACYYDNKRDTYLGDLYSVNWMEDSDKEDIEKETLEKQFQITKKETNMSHCQQYGDLSIAKLTVGEFQGEKPAAGQLKNVVNIARKDAVPSTDVPLKILERKIAKETDPEKKVALIRSLKAILENRRLFKTQMLKMATEASSDSGDVKQLVRIMEKRRPINDIDCHDEVVKHFDNECMRIGKNTYATRFVHMLVNMCEEKIAVQKIKKSIDIACAPLKGVNGLFI